jgi:hypothetical protein
MISNRFKLVTFLSASILFFTTTIFFSPGLLHDDSGWMLDQAIKMGINDWHPPILIWFWGFLFNPSTYGPLFPFLIQNFAFWLGVGLISIAVMRKNYILGLILPYFFLFIPQTFIVYWVSTDGSFIASSTLALGIISMSINHRLKRQFMLLGILVASLTFISRPYLWIIVGSILIGYFCFSSEGDLKESRIHYVLGIFLIPAVSLIFTTTVVKPADAHPESPVLLMDIMAMECLSRESRSTVPVDGLLPRTFVLHNVRDFCEDFDLEKSFMGYFINQSDPTQTRIRWIESPIELRIAIKAWLDGFFQEPQKLLQRKIVNYLGSNRPELYAAELAPNPKWKNPEVSSIGLGKQSGYPVDLSGIARKYLEVQIYINSSWIGKLAQSSHFLLLIGVCLHIFRGSRKDLWRYLRLLTPYFACAAFFFLTGMTTGGGRYFQSLNFILILLTIISLSLLNKNSQVEVERKMRKA